MRRDSCYPGGGGGGYRGNSSIYHGSGVGGMSVSSMMSGAGSQSFGRAASNYSARSYGGGSTLGTSRTMNMFEAIRHAHKQTDLISEGRQFKVSQSTFSMFFQCFLYSCHFICT